VAPPAFQKTNPNPNGILSLEHPLVEESKLVVAAGEAPSTSPPQLAIDH